MLQYQWLPLNHLSLFSMHSSNGLSSTNNTKKENIAVCFDLCREWMLAKVIWCIFFYFYRKVYPRKNLHFQYWSGCNISCCSLIVRQMLRPIFLWQSGKAGFQVFARFCFLIKLKVVTIGWLLFWRLKIHYPLRFHSLQAIFFYI